MPSQSESDLFAALANEVHVWLLPTDGLTLPHAQPLVSSLDAQEQARYRRFYFDADRLHFLAAHALLRCVLSCYLPHPPAHWQFRLGPQGKPQLANGGSDLLEFNLSHTKGLVGCVVSRARECGLDIEMVRSLHDMQGVAETVFSEAEIAWLASQPESERQRAFFHLWTLKEAFIKATGQGMSAPLRAIAFRPDEHPIRVQCPQHCGMPGTNWLFHRHEAYPSHEIAIAIAPRAGIDTLVYRRASFALDQMDGAIAIDSQQAVPAPVYRGD